MEKTRLERIEQILEDLDDTRVQNVLESRGYNLDFLDDENTPFAEQQRLLREQLQVSSESGFNSLYLDVARSTADDHVGQFLLKLQARADDLWRGAVNEMEEAASYIKDVLIPQADQTHKAGDEVGYRDKFREIEAASVALVTSVSQRQGDVREMLRKELYQEAPYMARDNRNALVLEAISNGEIQNGRLYAPEAISQSARAIVELRKTIANREQVNDDDLDMLIAARRDPSPRP